MRLECKLRFKNIKILTSNRFGFPNGYLVPIFSAHDDFIDPDQFPKQVYLTVISPGEVKGPHLHMKRWELFTCIRGNAKIVVRIESWHEEFFAGEDHDYATIQVPAGVPAALINIGDQDAYLLNMPFPAWHPDDQDEHYVVFDDYFEKEKRIN